MKMPMYGVDLELYLQDVSLNTELTLVALTRIEKKLGEILDKMIKSEKKKIDKGMNKLLKADKKHDKKCEHDEMMAKKAKKK